MQTVIVPICKNKNGNISDAGNYRPVSLATIISKLFKHYILSCISPLLATTDNLFGFKPKHGTDMCIFLLKQTVSYYVNKDTPVFSALLDASKAFDRTNHNLLFAKLIKHNVPMCIVRLLLSWYRQQTNLSKMRYQLLIPLYCNHWGKARGSPELILICCLPGWILNPAGISQGGMHCGKYGCESSNVCWWYMCVQPQYSWAAMSSEYLWWLCCWTRNHF